jgi:hypothetical protein
MRFGPCGYENTCQMVCGWKKHYLNPPLIPEGDFNGIFVDIVKNFAA